MQAWGYEGAGLRFLQYGTSDFWDLSIASPSDDNFTFSYNGNARGYFNDTGSNTPHTMEAVACLLN